ncbi:chromosomal replication initiator protein DnaA [Mycoplasma phocoeninasale]|uniref:Chromosomal replication initiator protein DnaA n=1 Tax=Mycoplasma phocoeninasale TaxID=2726117 RepID=A0A858U1N7_9MOLU|nr:chromosomal replication initiator protein DnaA [Mycoplasma phocoeninasale]MBN0970568.1 chromosomal replication initiator protein DnaA [Mycoplasma phocoeninasale]QJG66312.1 chromosomal replication initiator protein DnaA [Mycoplasma phocoeninasale]
MKTSKDLQADLKVNNISFQNELKNNSSDSFIYNQILSNIHIVHEQDDNVYLLCPESIFLYIKSAHSTNVARAIRNVYERPVNAIFITSLSELNSLNVVNGEQEQVLKNKKLFTDIKNNLTFDNYAVGKFNQIVLKAAKVICKSQKIIYSPLFIHSPSGLGKTHLLHAIGNELKKNNRSCLYINPDLFTRQLVEQLKSKNHAQINKIVDELTNYDCLMFDDVQQYGNKENTLNVLFNIINTMITNQKQIIICGDKKPNDLGGFEQRFITRFNGGLTLEIAVPDIEDVINILRFKLKENNIDPELWEDESLRFIARNFSNSIRSIEGAINRIKLFSEGDDYFTYDLRTMKSIFHNVTQIKENITPERIIDVVSKYYKIDKKKITSNSRKENIVIARRIAVYLIKNNFSHTLKDIGKMVGNQSHSTVIVSINWIDKNIKINPTLKLAIEKIKENLRMII